MSGGETGGDDPRKVSVDNAILDAQGKEPGIYLSTSGKVSIMSQGDHEWLTAGNSSWVTKGANAAATEGANASFVLGARSTVLAGADATVKAGVDFTVKVGNDLTAKLAADENFFLGPKVEAAATVGKVAAATSLVAAKWNHAYGDATKLGALEQRCSAQNMQTIADSIRAVGQAVITAGTMTQLVAQETHVASESVITAGIATRVENMMTQINTMTTFV
ncbi:MAG: hypothetical protein LBC14_02940 [Desulfovibrio sp.]|jgi:hypothetical protein|nr:hypothetical protein [Desulfovibrio sp.]